MMQFEQAYPHKDLNRIDAKVVFSGSQSQFYSKKIEIIQGIDYQATFSDGTTYIGPFNSLMLRHGKNGTLYNNEGKKIYHGEWKDDAKHGQGCEFLEDGSKLTGIWFINTLQQGDRLYANGDLFQGTFNLWLEPLLGTIVQLNGTMYHGSWSVSGKRHGKGKLTLPDGQAYEGDWVNDRPSGIGTAWLAVQGVIAIYYGQYEDGVRCGQGCMTIPSLCGNYTKRYTGYWQHDLPCGEGKMTVIYQSKASTPSSSLCPSLSTQYHSVSGNWENGVMEGNHSMKLVVNEHLIEEHKEKVSDYSFT